MKVALVLLALLAGCKFKPWGCAAQDAHTERFNCHKESEQVLIGFMDMGGGMQTPMYMWQDVEHCDERCVK